MLDTNVEDQRESTEFVSLVSGGQGYCIKITNIREIRRWSAVTTLPNSDKSVLGVMNLRGAVIPIVDLSAKLGFETTEVGSRCVVVVVNIESRVVGLLVEAVSEILSIPNGTIKPNPNVGKEAGQSCITGLFSVDDGMVKVLDVDNLFDMREQDVA